MAALAGVLLSAGLLGVQVWIVGTVALAWLVSRPVLGVPAVAKAAAALVASSVAYVAIVILIGATLGT